MKQLSARVTLCFIAFFLITVSLHAQQFQWVTGGGTTADDANLDNRPEGTYYMCTDPNGNVYALSHVGYYDVHADTFSANADESDFNLLLSSYNCQGQMRWAKLITSSGGNCLAYGIVADSLGHIYIAGYMNTATLHIGYDTSISGLEYEAQGLIQFDTSGHFNWIRFIGNNTIATFDGSVTYGSSLAVDSSNNVHFFNSMKYGVPITPTLTSHYGTYDLMYNPSGTLLSVKQLSLDSTLEIVGVIIDKPSNKAYAYGYRINYDWTGGGGDSSFYCFITAFDSGRNQIWIDTLAAPQDVGGQVFSGIATDGMGHLYACAVADGYLVYRGDTISRPPGAVGGYVACIMKTDTTGNMEWVKQCNANDGVAYNGLTLMPNNKVAAIGFFTGLASSGTTIINSVSGQDPFFTVVDTGGNLVSLTDIHGDGFYNWGNSIASDKVGNLYIGGSVADSIAVDCCNSITPYVSVGGNTDFFILKYGVPCDCTSMPVAAYTAIGTSTVNATYTGTTAPAIDSVVWNFGDGGTATGATATHVYTVVGTVDLCVTAYTGCGQDTHCGNITVNCTGGVASAFTDTGTTARGFTYTGTTAGLDSIVWNFGDGRSARGTTALHTYSASATYTVCATAYTGCGNNTSCDTVVINCTPIASFTDTGTTARGFTYTGTTGSVSWNFGDGYTGAGTNPTHIYSGSGIYTVCATVSTACGSNTACDTVVIDCAPVSSFTHSGTLPVDFTYTGTTAGLDSVIWNFGDGATGSGTAPSHIYSLSGTYTVCATVYATCGSNTYCHSVVVHCTPAAAFTDTGTITRGFTYTGTTASLDSVVWNFGDGSAANGNTALHTYTSIGTYTVCATAYTGCGSNAACDTVTISCVSVPTASFSDTGTHTIGFAYTGTTTGLDSVVWNFGDGTTGIGILTTHTYTASDTFHVCVIVYTSCGIDSACSDVVVHSLGVSNVAIADIKVYPNPAGNELNVTGVLQNTGYRLLNVTGMSVEQGALHQGNNTVPMQSVVPGVYIFELTGSNGERNMVRVVKE